jgi:mannose-6-phosphate isomerase-like protein (cupin superfamily)
MKKVNIREKLALFTEHWSPKVVGEVNDVYIKLVKFQGEFIWHRHETEDEMFLVVVGRMIMKFRDGEVALDPGEFIVVPRGVEHMPSAPEEVEVMLIEPRSTVNTGDVADERTRSDLAWI